MYDILCPSRIIAGIPEALKDDESLQQDAKPFAEMLAQRGHFQGVPRLHKSSTEAEAVKLFAHTYLALRVADFNELDAYAIVRGLNAVQEIEGIGLDPRIGDHYHNPPFGDGGNCLPRNTKQLLAKYEDPPRNLEEFKKRCNVIVANRYTEDLLDVQEKVFTRDVFQRD